MSTRQTSWMHVKVWMHHCLRMKCPTNYCPLPTCNYFSFLNSKWGPMHTEHVLIFFSGAMRILPLGFDTKPRLVFIHDSAAKMATSTCDLELHIPTCFGPAEFGCFKEWMIHSWWIWWCLVLPLHILTSKLSMTCLNVFCHSWSVHNFYSLLKFYTSSLCRFISTPCRLFQYQHHYNNVCKWLHQYNQLLPITWFAVVTSVSSTYAQVVYADSVTLMKPCCT